nr:hypothetical protein [Tanacetum cinerariifolium]
MQHLNEVKPRFVVNEVVEQVAYADRIIMNKIDLVCELDLETLICGLIGVPHSNGVLPQSPLHTRSLAVLKRHVEIRSCAINILIYLNGTQHDKRIAVIKNEFGKVDIDEHGSLVVSHSSANDDIVMLNNGCLCCTVRGLAKHGPVIEMLFEQISRYVKLCGVVTLVDCSHDMHHLNEVKPRFKLKNMADRFGMRVGVGGFDKDNTGYGKRSTTSRF